LHAVKDIVIERAEGPTDEVRLLVGELEAELSQHYPPEQRHGLTLDALFASHVRFFVAWADGRPAGCGGVAFFDGFAEVKRMYVRPEARGRGVAEAILARLVTEMSAAGVSLLRLETGVQQRAALRFYQRAGFRTCAAFEPYASMSAGDIAASIFLEIEV
jgi:putative acetyltransferase